METTAITVELALARFCAGAALVLVAFLLSIALRAALDWLVARLGRPFPGKHR